jgi:sorbose reductase
MPLYQPTDLQRPVLSQFSLQGKICLVTGGSRGIGRQIVQGLAEAGADVAFIYRSTPDADAAMTADEIAQSTKVRVKAFKCDVTRRQDTQKVISHIASDFGRGRLDVVVANAGVCSCVDSLGYDEDSWRHINGVNYDGAMWTAQAAGAIFKRQGRGNLIITASVSAHIVNVPQTQAAYNASKAAVLQLARGLAVEWVEFARVNCVSPGYVWTESKPPLSVLPSRVSFLWFFFWGEE